MKRFAPAKVNLGLRLLARRPDGYHEIETILHTLDWGDDVFLEPSEGISLEVIASPGAPFPERISTIAADASNLAWRAAAAALEALHLPGVTLRLEKRIPPGTGLGGGSSNAAAVLLGVAELYGVEFGGDTAAVLARRLGADVAFFLRGGCALAGGIGDRLTQIEPASGTAVVIAFPPEAVSTSWAYQAANYLLTRSGEYEDYLKGIGGVMKLCSLDMLSNDLEPAVVSAHPAIAEHLSALRQTDPFFVSLTGSGSAVYGLYDDAAAADEACRRLAAMGVEAVRTTLG